MNSMGLRIACGLWSPLMEATVTGLSLEDIVAISAFLASLDP